MARKGIFLVLSKATSPEEQAEFDRWYEEIHMPDSLLLPGFVRARRFRVGDEQLLPDRAAAPDFDYVTVFEIDDVDQVPDARALLPKLVGVSAQFFSPTLDRDSLRSFICEQVADVEEPTPLPDGMATLADVPTPDADPLAREPGPRPGGVDRVWGDQGMGSTTQSR